MTEHALLGPWVRRFLLEHLVGERNLARNTQRSYRDTLRLLLPFAARSAGKAIDRLRVEDLSADRVRAFLGELEEKRGCGAATRNQRLAAIRSLAHFIGLRSPEHVQWCGEVRSIAVQEGAPAPGELPGEGGDGRPAGGAGCWVRPRAAGTTPCCCSCTTPERGPTRRPTSRSTTSTWGRCRSAIPPRS